jgi:uncharacterized integral membrane protein
MKTIVSVALSVVLAAYAVYVALWNEQGVDVHLLFTSLEQVGLGVVVLCSFLAGAAAAGLALAWPILRLRLRARGQSRRVTRLEQEVHGLRTLPLAESDEPERAAASREG